MVGFTVCLHLDQSFDFAQGQVIIILTEVLSGREWWKGGRGILRTTLCFHYIFCFHMGIDENYFVVLFIAEGKVTQPCPRAVAFEQKCELKQSKI